MNRTDCLAKDLVTIFQMTRNPLPSDDLEEVIRLEGGRPLSDEFIEAVRTGDFSKIIDDNGERPPSL